MEEKKKMKTLKIIGAILVLALIVVGATLASVSAFGGWMRTPYNQQTGPWHNGNNPQTQGPITQTDTSTPTLYTPMMPNGGYNGWGRGGCMNGRWGNIFGNNPATSTGITISQAVDIARTYVSSLNNADLEVKEVEEYTNNFYVLVAEKSTGNGAFELLINKANGIVRPEPGPNMMWNNKYSFGNGWCNWAQGTTVTTPTVTVDQAKTDAQEYLNTYLQGTNVGDITAFSGHYTIEVLKNGTPYGMLSVNAFTGQTWFHNWHGAFIQEQTVA
jgi:hypothetical protein